MIRNLALLAVLSMGLSACMAGGGVGGGDMDVATDPGDALANPSDGFENENMVE